MPPFFAILQTFSWIGVEISVKMINKVHRVTQLIELDLMMHIYITFAQRNNSTELLLKTLIKIRHKQGLKH